MSGVTVSLSADPGDGNDPIEATVPLPGVPRVGDTIEVWSAKSGPRGWTRNVACPICEAEPGAPCLVSSASPGGAMLHRERVGPTGEPLWLEVEAIVWHPATALLRGGQVEVAVRMEGYDLEALRRAMEAADTGEHP